MLHVRLIVPSEVNVSGWLGLVRGKSKCRESAIGRRFCCWATSPRLPCGVARVGVSLLVWTLIEFAADMPGVAVPERPGRCWVLFLFR